MSFFSKKRSSSSSSSNSKQDHESVGGRTARSEGAKSRLKGLLKRPTFGKTAQKFQFDLVVHDVGPLRGDFQVQVRVDVPRHATPSRTPPLHVWQVTLQRGSKQYSTKPVIITDGRACYAELVGRLAFNATIFMGQRRAPLRGLGCPAPNDCIFLCTIDFCPGAKDKIIEKKAFKLCVESIAPDLSPKRLGSTSLDLAAFCSGVGSAWGVANADGKRRVDVSVDGSSPSGAVAVNLEVSCRCVLRFLARVLCQQLN